MLECRNSRLHRQRGNSAITTELCVNLRKRSEVRSWVPSLLPPAQILACSETRQSTENRIFLQQTGRFGRVTIHHSEQVGERPDCAKSGA